MKKPRFQFGLKAVFVGTAGAAILLAVFYYMPLAARQSVIPAALGVLCFVSFEAVVAVLSVRLCLWLIDRRRPPDA